MRIRQVKEKLQQQVALPQQIVELFKQVSIDIQNKEEYTQIESDDLIQPGYPATYIFGGLSDKKKQLYQFVYYPVEGSTEFVWELELTAEQIKQIADGSLKKLTLWGCVQDNCKSKFTKETGICYQHDIVEDGIPDPPKLSADEISKLDYEKRILLEKWKTENPLNIDD